MKWYSYLICIVLIIVGIFSTINMVEIFSVKSGEYGKVITFETENNYEEVSRFDYGTIEFDTDDYVTYKNITTYAPANFDGSKIDYKIFFNGKPLNNVVQTAGRISGNISIKFYDLEAEVITTADLNFVVEYLASLTKVTVTIENVDSSVSYLASYMEVNGAVLKVVTKGVTQ